jgi:AcrR family transcriptional regulator
MQSRSSSTRQKILSTSYELFSHQGYEATGVALICEKANISKGAFYHHFPSKKDVFFTLVESWLDQIQTQFAGIKDNQEPVPDQLLAMIPALSSVFTEADQIPFFLEFWLQAMRDPEIAQRTIKPYYSFMSLFEKMFERGVAEGSIDPGSDPHQSMRLVIAFAIGMIMQSMLEPKREDWNKVSQYSLEKVLNGLQNHKESI